ncbi:MAG: glutamate--tRNA ligase [Gammaproteobacteria bacterium]|nr:glutamate--tRNA ligase [Gammaproteobacteria bacterium]
MTFRTRFAPSPTGSIHVGNLRSAIFPWVLAKSRAGTFILRIEDSDSERSNQESIDNIIKSLSWLGLQPDEGPYFQSQRWVRYREVAEELLAIGAAYWCYQTKEELDILKNEFLNQGYNGQWRPMDGKILPPIPLDVKPVLRFLMPQTGRVAWQDAVKGCVSFENQELDDWVMLRSDGTPTYNFCVVVDDIDMLITHVIRGDDHVNNTPKQIHLYQALSKTVPTFAHLPTVLDGQGNKLSKRNGAKSVLDYRQEGYLPQALINYLSRLGWSHGDDEIFTVEQLIDWFDLAHIGASATKFDEQKLLWVNTQHIQKLSLSALVQQLENYWHNNDKAYISQNFRTSTWEEIANHPRFLKMCALVQTRCTKLRDFFDWYDKICRRPNLNQQELQDMLSKDSRIVVAIDDLLLRVSDLHADQVELPHITDIITHCQREYALKMAHFAVPLRYLLIGEKQSLAVDDLLVVLGKTEAIQRLSALKDYH